MSKKSVFLICLFIFILSLLEIFTNHLFWVDLSAKTYSLTGIWITELIVKPICFLCGAVLTTFLIAGKRKQFPVKNRAVYGVIGVVCLLLLVLTEIISATFITGIGAFAIKNQWLYFCPGIFIGIFVNSISRKDERTG